MSTFRIAIIPGLIAGIISVFTSWLWMGMIFHRFQKQTPETWRAEGLRSYLGASLLHVWAGIRHRLLVHINSALPDGTLRDWISGKPLLCRLHLGCTGATDSSRIRHLCSSPSTCCPRPASRLANYFCSRLHHHMVVAEVIEP